MHLEPGKLGCPVFSIMASAQGLDIRCMVLISLQHCPVLLLARANHISVQNSVPELRLPDRRMTVMMARWDRKEASNRFWNLQKVPGCNDTKGPQVSVSEPEWLARLCVGLPLLESTSPVP